MRRIKAISNYYESRFRFAFSLNEFENLFISCFYESTLNSKISFSEKSFGLKINYKFENSRIGIGLKKENDLDLFFGICLKNEKYNGYFLYSFMTYSMSFLLQYFYRDFIFSFNLVYYQYLFPNSILSLEYRI